MKTSPTSYRPCPHAPILSSALGILAVANSFWLLGLLLLSFTLGGCRSASPVSGVARLGQAPDFSLLDQAERPVTLSKLRGQWVVLYFHPVDDAPGCACKATAFTGLLRRIGELKAKAFAISTDIPEMSSGWHAKYQLTSPALSDPDHQVAQQYGAWDGKIKRTVVIVNPQGQIVYRQHIRQAQGAFGRMRKILQRLL